MHIQGLLAADGGERTGMDELLVGILEVGIADFGVVVVPGKPGSAGDNVLIPEKEDWAEANDVNLDADKVGAVCEGGFADFGAVDKLESGGNEKYPERDGNWVLDIKGGNVLAVERVGAVWWEDGNIAEFGVAEVPEIGGNRCMAAGILAMWVAGFGAEGIEGDREGNKLITGAGDIGAVL